MFANLVCTVAQGFGAITAYPGIVETARYNDAVIELRLSDSGNSDIVVTGPLDARYSFDAHNLTIAAKRAAGKWVVNAQPPVDSPDYLSDTIIVNDTGRMLWASAANSADAGMASVALYSGNCKPAK